MRLWLFAAAAALLAGSVARADTTFQPEVLLTRTSARGTEKSFDYARLKPATVAGNAGSATFMYRAGGATVTCTIAVTSVSGGVVRADLTIQRQTTLPDGNTDTTTKTQKLNLRPGKKLIVDNQPHMDRDGIDGEVEVLQIGIAK